jgi:hypothetical protein
MDTDDLTEMAYEIITRADDVLDALRTEIGASAIKMKTEDDFLRGVEARLRKILKSPKSYLDTWNYSEKIEITDFQKRLSELISFVNEVLATPYSQRGETAF